MSVELIKYGDPVESANDGIEKVILEKLIKITAEAKSRCPVGETTRLRNSIMYRTKDQMGGHSDGPMLSAQPKKFQGIVGTAVLYGTYQEFGTRYIPPQPFLRPAIAIHGFNKDVKEVTAIMNNVMRAKMKDRASFRFF